jgi:hypothetical protein
MLDCSVLRPETRDPPVSVSTGGDPLRKISKAVAPRDTKVENGEPSRRSPSGTYGIESGSERLQLEGFFTRALERCGLESSLR